MMGDMLQGLKDVVFEYQKRKEVMAMGKRGKPLGKKPTRTTKTFKPKGNTIQRR